MELIFYLQILHGSIDPFIWNKENPTKGYCYRALNDFPFDCGSDCERKCGKDRNRPEDNGGEYDPNIDFSQCENHKLYGCIEKKLNFLSGHSCLTTVGCKECINKYCMI